MIEIKITHAQAAAVSLLIERALALSGQSANMGSMLGLDVDTRERVESVKNKIKIS